MSEAERAPLISRFGPGGPLRGTLRPPADKSISHRAALIGAMCEGELLVENYLRAQDTLSTLGAVAALGAEVSDDGDALRIRGAGLRGARPLDEPIDVGNAGTLLRLLPGWLAGQPGGAWTLDGDDSIRRRPVDRVAAPLRAMGAAIECTGGRLPPLRVAGAALHGIHYELPVASAQVKSCVLLAGLLAAGETTVVEPAPTRDHTERMLMAAGAPIEVDYPPASGAEHAGASVTVSAADRLGLERVEVPGDLSSAAFAIAAAVLVPGSEVRIERAGVNRTRTGFLRILRRMGAHVEGEVEDFAGGAEPAEPAADLVVRHAALQATRVEPDEVPLVIDELPLVALLGCFAEGDTVVRGAEELRHKESDRIATVVGGLRALGADIEAAPDGFAVRGSGGLRGGTIEAAGDHRLAMLGAVAGLASAEGVTVEGMDAAAVSYPGFEAGLARLSSGA